jgi:hypothetical protein
VTDGAFLVLAGVGLWSNLAAPTATVALDRGRVGHEFQLPKSNLKNLQRCKRI